MLRVSLICPLGKMRMVTPCRASTCMHLQCFDSSLYVQMNERKPTWNCPVCDKPALYENLVIDGYFQEVIASSKLGPDDNEIQLHPDGSWSTLSNKTNQERESPKKSFMKVEVIEDDLGELRGYFLSLLAQNFKSFLIRHRTYHRRISEIDDQIELRIAITEHSKTVNKRHSGDSVIGQWRWRRLAQR